jgi:hypothetical protein
MLDCLVCAKISLLFLVDNEDDDCYVTGLTSIKEAKGVGFFKCSGVQLTEEQQDWEFELLNPRVAHSTVQVTKFAASATPTNTKGYLVSFKSNHYEGTQDTEVVGECTNSTGTFVPPYWYFVFSDTSVLQQ